MKIKGLRCTRCMCDVSAMHLWRLHDECAAYCYTPMIKIIRHSSADKIRYAVIVASYAKRTAQFCLYLELQRTPRQRHNIESLFSC